MDGWQSIAGQLAAIGLPAIGGLIAGPLGGTVGTIAGKAVAAALGVDPTPQAVSQAIQADPDGARVRLAEIEAETKRQDAHLADLASARAMQSVAVSSGSGIAWVPVAFSVLNYVILVGVIVCVSQGWLREDGIIVGFALGAATSAYNFWLGSSESAKRSADTVRRVVDNGGTVPARRAS